MGDDDLVISKGVEDSGKPDLSDGEQATKDALFDKNRNFIFAVNEKIGEYIWKMYVGEWLKDPESDTELRYMLAGKRTSDFKVHYVLFVQVRSEGYCMILDEGVTADLQFKKIWKRLLNDIKGAFGDVFEYKKWDFASMGPERRDGLFNSIVSEER